MLKIKQLAAIAMSFLIMSESFTCANAKNSMSGLHNFFKNNLNETIALSSGGAGALALFLTAVACSNKKSDISCKANADKITQASVLNLISNSEKKLNRNIKKYDKKYKFNAELILVSCLDLPNEHESTATSENKHEDEPSKVSDLVSGLPVIPKTKERSQEDFDQEDDDEAKNVLGSDSDASDVILESKERAQEDFDQEDDDEAKSVLGSDSDASDVILESKEQAQEEEEDFDWDDDDECEGVYGSDSDDQDDEDSENNCVGEILDFEKNGVTFEFSPELSRRIKLLCGSIEWKVTYMETLIMMLAKLKNENHRPEDITSLVEANFTRCERQYELYQMGNRVFNQYDLLLLMRLADDIVDLSQSGYWKTVKEMLFRGVELHGTTLEFNRSRVPSATREEVF